MKLNVTLPTYKCAANNIAIEFVIGSFLMLVALSIVVTVYYAIKK